MTSPTPSLVPETDAQLAAAVEALKSTLGTTIEAIYLHGSAVLGGFKPASDLDILVLTNQPTDEATRRQLVDRLTPISDRTVRPPGWRPIELTIVVQSDIQPWRYPPPMDFQWGEWLRSEYEAGTVPAARNNPDLAVLLAMARGNSETLFGRPAAEALPPIPPNDLRRSMVAGIGALMDDIVYDTSNVLLTLARIWHSLATAEFTSKDMAAEWALGRLRKDKRAALERARDVYLGLAEDEWADLGGAPREQADELVARISELEVSPG